MAGCECLTGSFLLCLGSLEERRFFDRWIIVQFFDEEKLPMASRDKDAEPVDPYIGMFENVELVVR